VGRKYRSKSKSGCAMCKPNKHGWDYKFKPKERKLREMKDKEIKEAK